MVGVFFCFVFFRGRSGVKTYSDFGRGPYFCVVVEIRNPHSLVINVNSSPFTIVPEVFEGETT